MTSQSTTHTNDSRLRARLGFLGRMFNLNDPRWGRGDGGNGTGESARPDASAPTPPPTPEQERKPQKPAGANQGPPDLDELWRDFNRNCLA